MINYFTIFVIIIFLFLSYSIIPTLIIRICRLGITKKLKVTEGIALTFDDGPNPLYTPLLLDLLKKHGIKATFFVVGRKVQQYPDLIKRMYEEGHAIGIHHFDHISSWKLSPFRLRKQLLLTEKEIRKITDEDVIFYRPPWGRFNIFSLLLSKKYQIIMWSGIFGDWKIDKCQSSLLKELQSMSPSGKILLLHDCGETSGADNEAPKYMLEQLEQYLEDSRDKIHFINLKDYFTSKGGIYEHTNDLNLS